MALKINTQKVSATATIISRENKDILDAFDAVKRSIDNMTRNWQGSAAAKSREAFDKIKEDFVRPRYESINTFVRFLNECVGQGYEETEDTLTKSAQAFK
ncbi:MAG: WXG100 family type VII secretion target [Clostridia bacterium]|nr:WXG100 family type VII secretion target [Clostridia bacterium]